MKVNIDKLHCEIKCLLLAYQFLPASAFHDFSRSTNGFPLHVELEDQIFELLILLDKTSDREKGREYYKHFRSLQILQEDRHLRLEKLRKEIACHLNKSNLFLKFGELKNKPRLFQLDSVVAKSVEYDKLFYKQWHL